MDPEGLPLDGVASVATKLACLLTVQFRMLEIPVQIALKDYI